LYGFVALPTTHLCGIDVQFLSAESCYIAIRAGIIISISFLEQPKMKLPLVKSASAVFSTCRGFGLLIFLSQAWLLVV
jgi:hypothetical protein